MSQFRQNPITKQWVLIAPARAKRPEDYKTYSVMAGLPEVDSTCVFCPGNEDKNPDIEGGNWRRPAGKNWEVRIINNKYPALELHPSPEPITHQHHTLRGIGSHEVIITRRHNEPVALQSAQTVLLTLQMFADRIRALSQDERLAYVQVFHNHGRDAGASLIHPHHQLLALPLVPEHQEAEMRGCEHYYEVHGSCVYCDMLRDELHAKDRVVFEDEHFVVLSAYASRKPFETWIIPKRHSASFEDAGVDELRHLAYVLKFVLGQLYVKLSDPPLNFYIHTAPFVRHTKQRGQVDSYHWHVTIFPRLTIWAGFEYATGIPINPMPPELTAEFLRGGL